MLMLECSVLNLAWLSSCTRSWIFPVSYGLLQIVTWGDPVDFQAAPSIVLSTCIPWFLVMWISLFECLPLPTIAFGIPGELVTRIPVPSFNNTFTPQHSQPLLFFFNPQDCLPPLPWYCPPWWNVVAETFPRGSPWRGMTCVQEVTVLMSIRCRSQSKPPFNTMMKKDAFVGRAQVLLAATRFPKDWTFTAVPEDSLHRTACWNLGGILPQFIHLETSSRIRRMFEGRTVTFMITWGALHGIKYFVDYLPTCSSQ